MNKIINSRDDFESTKDAENKELEPKKTIDHLQSEEIIYNKV